MYLHLFGAATPSGEAFRQAASIHALQGRLLAYSRRKQQSLLPADFNDPASFRPGGEPGAPGLWISFGPIWLLASFLDQLAKAHPERLQGLKGIIACSSSSALTKRFASNRFDRDLVSKLTCAEDLLLANCRRMSVPCCILQPTLIYGQAGPYGDRNISRLIHQLMRRFPLLPLPAETGLRQPIHASQLAAVAVQIADQITKAVSDLSTQQRIALGGDTTLTYTEMIIALQKVLLAADPARRCRLLPIPNRLFFLMASPIGLHSPKAFEAVLRMGANLSGFTPAHELLGCDPQPFPVLPLA